METKDCWTVEDRTLYPSGRQYGWWELHYKGEMVAKFYNEDDANQFCAICIANEVIPTSMVGD
jgi:hypothetical protein